MRPDIARARTFWITQLQPFMRNHLERLAFIDETSLKTNLIKATGWAPVGDHLIDHAPFGHWNTQTFIAALRSNRLDAPWVIKGARNRDLFNTYIETQLAPTLGCGDVVILPSHRCKRDCQAMDNLPTHKSAYAAEVLYSIGSCFRPYSPDLNPASQDIALQYPDGQ